MSVAICSWSSATVSFPLEKQQQQQQEEEALGSPLVPRDDVDAAAIENEEQAAERGQLVDIWTSIQAQSKAKESKDVHEPYVHPSSSSLMSQKSLEICTESLGSETGSDDYDNSVLFSTHRPPLVVAHQQQEQRGLGVDAGGVTKRKEHAAAAASASVNYHCSIGRRSPNRSFPPPLPSISCRDGTCVQMRPHRKDGRLVVEAVAVPSQNYLHADRQGGRLLLSFINNAANTQEQAEEEAAAAAAELEEEEEVEVVDRGAVVEVKVSTQPQKQSGGSAAMKVHRSTSIVINKFVSCTPPSGHDEESVADSCRSTTSAPRRSTTGTTTAAAAAAAASSLGTFPADDGGDGPPRSDNKLLLFTSKRRSREELVTDMKRCSQLRKPLFIWETCCIATSSS